MPRDDLNWSPGATPISLPGILGRIATDVGQPGAVADGDGSSCALAVDLGTLDGVDDGPFPFTYTAGSCWFTFLAGATSLLLSVGDPDTPHLFGYSGGCGSLVEIASRSGSMGMTGLTLGERYRLRVDRETPGGNSLVVEVL